MHDKANAKFLENRVSAADMRAFVCKDKTDQNRFLELVRDQQNLAVAAVHMGTKAAEEFVPNKPLNAYRYASFTCSTIAVHLRLL